TSHFSRPWTVATALFSPRPTAMMAAGQKSRSWNSCATIYERAPHAGASVHASAIERSSTHFPIQSPRMRSSVKSLCAVVALLVFPVLLHAEPIAQLRPTDYVNDFAHVLDQDTIAQLDDICLQIEQKAHAQIAVVTINSLDGSDIESYAVELF